MASKLTTLEEFDIERRLQAPHTIKCQNLSQKKDMAFYILSKNINNLLLITPSGFSTTSVLSGLSEEHIEYIATNAPDEYKKEVAESLSKDYMEEEIVEIAKAMDDDLNGDVTQNQDRVKNVIQYIKDNRIAFEF